MISVAQGARSSTRTLFGFIWNCFTPFTLASFWLFWLTAGRLPPPASCQLQTYFFFILLLLPLFHFLWVFLTPTTAFCSYECLSTCALIFRLLWFNRARSLRDFRGIHGCGRVRSTCTIGLSITDTDMWAHPEWGMGTGGQGDRGLYDVRKGGAQCPWTHVYW